VLNPEVYVGLSKSEFGSVRGLLYLLGLNESIEVTHGVKESNGHLIGEAIGRIGAIIAALRPRHVQQSQRSSGLGGPENPLIAFEEQA
jgi:hypothetical protein